jgi:hypothetical protein
VSQVLAAIGAAAILSAFWALQTGRLRTEQRRYQLVNLVGAGLLATSAVMTHAWAFIVLNGAWALIALRALVRRAPSP